MDGGGVVGVVVDEGSSRVVVVVVVGVLPCSFFSDEAGDRGFYTLSNLHRLNVVAVFDQNRATRRVVGVFPLRLILLLCLGACRSFSFRRTTP